jgi:hypothetical protein
MTHPIFSLASMLFHRKMDYVEDSAKMAGPIETGEDTMVGTTNESKALCDGNIESPQQKMRH